MSRKADLSRRSALGLLTGMAALPAMASGPGRLRMGRATAVPVADYVAHNYTELLAILSSDIIYPKTSKTLLIAGDCSGPEILIATKTWPGFTIRGTSTVLRPLMPRLTFNAVNGSVGLPILLKWLNFYNVSTQVPTTSYGQISFITGTSSWFEIADCTMHDDPFSSKTFKGDANPLKMYRGIGCLGGGKINNFTMYGSEIYNQNRSFINGDDVLVYDCDVHDYYNNAITITGNHHTYRNIRCWNIWAVEGDKSGSASPHASLSISFQPSGTGNMSDILCEGVIAVVGVARYLYDGSFPIALGLEFNDMIQTGWNYVRCTVRNCMMVGTSTIMLEFDGGIDCVSEWNTFVEDISQSSASLPIIYSDGNVNVIHRHNIVYAFSEGNDGRGTVYLYDNASANPNATGASSLIAYENIFVGQGGATPFGFFTSVSAALTAFVLKGSHPYASWTIQPGATAYYNWTTGVGSWPATSVPTTNNVTAQTSSPVTKPSDAVLRKTTTGGAWLPTNKRKGTVIFKLSNDVTIDNSTRQAFSISSGSMTLERLSTDVWRFNLDSATGDSLSMVSTFNSAAVDGMVVVAVSWDIDQAKAQMKFAANGVIQQDLATISVFEQAPWDAAGGTTLTLGDTSAGPGSSAWVGQYDTVVANDTFTDMETSAGLATVFNTSGALADISGMAATAGIYIHTAAANYNAGTANTGIGTGGGGAALTLAKVGAGTFS